MDTNVLLVYRHLEDTEPYRSAMQLAGIDPVLEVAHAGLSLGNCTGLLLMGGSDVNPARYGEQPVPETEAPDDERDAVECALISEALSREVPIFAICRGLQILNVYFGGTLIQHLPDTARHRRRTPNRGLPAHNVVIEPDTLLASIAGSRTWQVNSRHHQAIGRLGNRLRVNARDAEDGTVEGVELSGKRFVLGVQWHPENQVHEDAGQRKLFESFAAAVRSRVTE